MSTIPLVALSSRPQIEQPDAVGAIGRAMQIQQQQQAIQGNANALQQQQLNLATQRQLATASHDPSWDPTDPDSVVKTLSRYNVPLPAQAAIMQNLRAMQQGLNATSKENLEALDNAHSFIDDQLQGVKAAPQEVREKAYQSALGNIVQYAQNMAPNMRQAILQEVSSAPPLFDSNYIDFKHGLLKTQSALTKDSLEKAQTAEATGKAAQAGAEAGLASAKIPGASAESTMQQQNAALGPQGRALAGNLFFGAAGGDEQSEKALGLETAQKVAAAAASFAGAPSALRGVAPHLVPAATQAATKLGTDYATFTGQMKNLSDQLASAKTGDEVASAFAPVAASLGSNAFYGTHRFSPTEVQTLEGLGSVGRQMNAWFDKHATGTLNPDTLTEFQGLVSRLEDAKAAAYKNGLQVVNQNYGSNFQPTNFSQSGQTSTGHVIDISGRRYRYNGSGDTADLKNYTPVSQ